MSNESDQNAALAHSHIYVPHKIVDMTQTEFFWVSTNWDCTDECDKKYRCSKAPCFLIILEYMYDIVINKCFGDQGHGWDAVESLNAQDKCFLWYNWSLQILKMQ